MVTNNPSVERGNNPPGFINGTELFDQLSEINLSKRT
jgi:hypothetical protein